VLVISSSPGPRRRSPQQPRSLRRIPRRLRSLRQLPPSRAQWRPRPRPLRLLLPLLSRSPRKWLRYRQLPPSSPRLRRHDFFFLFMWFFFHALFMTFFPTFLLASPRLLVGLWFSTCALPPHHYISQTSASSPLDHPSSPNPGAIACLLKSFIIAHPIIAPLSTTFTRNLC
jgi:hypothetical protein